MVAANRRSYSHLLVILASSALCTSSSPSPPAQHRHVGKRRKFSTTLFQHYLVPRNVGDKCSSNRKKNLLLYLKSERRKDDESDYSNDFTTPLKFQCYVNDELSRRVAILRILSLSSKLLSISATAPAASASSEIDGTGQLFTPKNEMIGGGGSASARGIPFKPIEEKRKSQETKENKKLLKRNTGLIQNVYETRFITYLARFLLVFDPSANAWWRKNSNSSRSLDDNADDGAADDMNRSPIINSNNDISKERFAEFAESCELGLADYFIGPYGSYASVAAAKAGIAALAPAKSNQLTTTTNKRSGTAAATKKSKEYEVTTRLARQGVLNLFTLLKARYTTVEAKQQLAILFSLISNPDLQPVQEIRGLLGEIDNGTIAAVELFDISSDNDEGFRLSSRHGGGFSINDVELIQVEPPAPLGDEYKPATLRAVMKPTSRILRINVIDGGSGYSVSPDVVIKQSGTSRECEAVAIIDRNGSVSEIIVVNPGFGYGGQQQQQNNGKGNEPTIPTVEMRLRKSRQSIPGRDVVKPAKAVAELEYEVVGVDIIDGGSGYLFDQPPKVTLVLPQTDPDWFATPIALQDTEDDESQLILASVTQMKNGANGVIVDTSAVRRGRDELKLDNDALRTIKSDPIALLPSVVRPQYTKFISGSSSRNIIENGYYYISSLPPYMKADVAFPSSLKKYRSIDPLFGGIGKAPVVKNALTLSSSQYLRLAVSGAICTVLVRTALNPLELVKTKIQLGNDKEILQLAMNASLKESGNELTSTSKKPTVGTSQVIKTLIDVRGPLSLFQSADITLLTSVVFGLFGFGATELFRRSFSAVFFDETAAGPSEFLLLAAATLSTLLTCAVGAPFEILRVRSMSTTENQGVNKVFKDFIEENRSKRGKMSVASASSLSASAVFPKGMPLEDIKPLWSSFIPIASRELPFALTKFLVFDLASQSIADFINGSNLLGDGEIQVGVGGLGLFLSAFAGALAGKEVVQHETE